jgi:hypothetical protein
MRFVLQDADLAQPTVAVGSRIDGDGDFEVFARIKGSDIRLLFISSTTGDVHFYHVLEKDVPLLEEVGFVVVDRRLAVGNP